MVQTVKTVKLQPGEQKLFLEKPHVLCRIYFKVAALIAPGNGYKSYISFDDPLFEDYYILSLANNYLEVKGEGIFQGNIWVRNQSSVLIDYAATEILV